MDHPARILAVDDTPAGIRLLEALLTPRGYTVLAATSGPAALAQVASDPPDLVLLDVVMPEMSGLEVCRRLRADPATRALPIVLITASGDQPKVEALEAGADDFITKPLDRAELLARVRSLLRIKEYHDTIQRQAAELAQWAHTLEARVEQQVQELDRLGRLRRFLSPQLAEAILSSGDERVLESHRREITVVFIDLRGFTAFAAMAEPEDVMAVLREYHAAMGELIFEYEGTLERFAGDGLMVFFNDPFPCDDPAGRAVRMAVAMRARVDALAQDWHKRGHQLDFGVGIAQGYATLGRVGFEGRFDYAAIGTVTNLASRLCGEAQPGQILVSQRVQTSVEQLAETEPLGELTLKGFQAPVPAFNVLRLRA
jgi:adenylate cyclase